MNVFMYSLIHSQVLFMDLSTVVVCVFFLHNLNLACSRFIYQTLWSTCSIQYIFEPLTHGTQLLWIQSIIVVPSLHGLLLDSRITALRHLPKLPGRLV